MNYCDWSLEPVWFQSNDENSFLSNEYLTVFEIPSGKFWDSVSRYYYGNKFPEIEEDIRLSCGIMPSNLAELPPRSDWE